MTMQQNPTQVTYKIIYDTYTVPNTRFCENEETDSISKQYSAMPSDEKPPNYSGILERL